ncbi:MAG: DUF937 domain-containing protein [Planctomycetales bacterium]|nr:DUF937 domain-containing protein [bacterium]UNM09378.1 MAG: DUF937 domain-containing protein [Planctomycetales bacterium]
MDKSILDTIFSQLGDEQMKQLGQHAGVDEGKARQGLEAVIPVLLGAMERNASDGGGAESLKNALEKDHDGSILDQLGEYLGNPEQGKGGGILKHVLGERRSKVEERLASRTELDQGPLGKLMELAAPLVMGALGKQQKQQGGFSLDNLSEMLGKQREASESGGGLLGMAADMLDSDGDGDIMDDLGGLAGKLFGR